LPHCRPEAESAVATAPTAPPASTGEAVLDAAERHFAGSGYAGASMREIAAEARLRNQASLYHYYRSKQQLYDAVIVRAVAGILPAYATPDGAPLAASLDRLIDYLIAHPHVARLIERAGMEEDRQVRLIVERRLRPLFEAGVRVLDEARGPWQPSELPHLAAGLYHLIFGYFASASLLHAVMREDPYAPATLARQRRFIISAVGRLLGSEAASSDVRRATLSRRAT
jgi:AcrR family transcriptional regulator